MNDAHFKMRTLVKLQLDSKLCWALCNILMKRNLAKLDGDIEADQRHLLTEFGRGLAGHMGGEPHPLIKLDASNEKILSWYALFADRKHLKETINNALAAINSNKPLNEMEDLLRDGLSKTWKSHEVNPVKIP